MVTLVSYPVAPTVEKLRGTLLDTVEIDNEHFAGLDGIGLFQSWNSLTFEGSPVFCGTNAKDLDQQAGWMDGVRFGAYGGVTCKMVDPGEQEAGAKAAFERGESKAVEQALMALRFVDNPDGTGLLGTWPAPTDITPAGGAVSVDIGMALLQEYAASIYSGEPTLHMPRSAASLLANSKKIEFEGDVLRTSLGAKVAAGAGYAYPNTGPTGADAPDGERWIYATGSVWIGRSQVIAHTAFDQSTNEVVTLVERGYVAAVDGFAAAVRVVIEG